MSGAAFRHSAPHSDSGEILIRTKMSAEPKQELMWIRYAERLRTFHIVSSEISDLKSTTRLSLLTVPRCRYLKVGTDLNSPKQNFWRVTTKNLGKSSSDQRFCQKVANICRKRVAISSGMRYLLTTVPVPSRPPARKYRTVNENLQQRCKHRKKDLLKK